MSPHRVVIRSEFVIALSFIVLIPVMVGLWSVDRSRGNAIRNLQAIEAWSRYDTSIAGCARGNLLRATMNDQSSALVSVSFILSAFLDSSVDLRLGAGRPGLAEQARQARDRIARIAEHISPIPQVDCAVIIPRPTAPQPKETAP